MSFLTGLLASIVEWALTGLFAMVKKDYAQYQADKAAAAAALLAEQNLEKAKTKDEIDKATDSSLNNL